MAESSVALMQQLHDEHAAALWGYCLRLTGHDRARAEDVVQETLLRAWRHHDRLDECRGSVRSWLFTVARNIVIDEWRTRAAARGRRPRGARGPRRGRPHRPAAHVVAGRRGRDVAVRRPPGGAARVLLPRRARSRRRRTGSASPRERSSRAPTTLCGHCDWRCRRWGSAHDLPLRPPRRRLRAGRRCRSGRAARVRDAPARLRRVQPRRARPRRAARAARPVDVGRPRGADAGRTPPRRRSFPRWCARSVGRSGVARCSTAAVAASMAAVVVSALAIGALRPLARRRRGHPDGHPQHRRRRRADGAGRVRPGAGRDRADRGGLGYQARPHLHLRRGDGGDGYDGEEAGAYGLFVRTRAGRRRAGRHLEGAPGRTMRLSGPRRPDAPTSPASRCARPTAGSC